MRVRDGSQRPGEMLGRGGPTENGLARASRMHARGIDCGCGSSSGRK